MAEQTNSTAPLVNQYLDDRVFKFQVYFWNRDGKILGIPRGTIKDLVIEDNILNWYMTGHMEFINTKDVMERHATIFKDGQEVEMEPYRFRNDGKDYLYIEIDIPIQDDLTSNESLNDSTYTLRLLASVYDIEDIPSNNPNEKRKKVYFYDYRQQLMEETNLMWSSANALKRQKYTVPSKSVYLVPDSERGIYTGHAIKDILTQCLKTDTTEPKFAEDFSVGGERFMYTSPIAYRAHDDLKYMMDHHTHDNKNSEPCLLRCDRFTNEWSLLPISEYFNRAYDPSTGMPGAFLKDRMFIGDESMPTTVSTNMLRTPSKSTAKNNYWVDGNIINNFQFNEMPAVDSSEIINTTAVQTYDWKNKQFYTCMEQSDIQNVKQYMEETVFNNLPASMQGLSTAFALNNNKLTNRNMDTKYTVTQTVVRNTLEGRNKTMMGAILNGNSIAFTVKGLPSRVAGRFTSIDRDTGYVENDYDDKLLGLYLNTKVTHMINNSGYMNHIIAVKPYTYSKIDYTSDT